MTDLAPFEQQALDACRFGFRVLLIVCVTTALFTAEPSDSDVQNEAVEELNAWNAFDLSAAIDTAVSREPTVDNELTALRALVEELGGAASTSSLLLARVVASLPSRTTRLEGVVEFLDGDSLSVEYYKMDSVLENATSPPI